MSIIDISGKKFNRLTVIRLLEKRRYGGYRDWLCKCDCGKETTATTKSLISGRTKSCGCYRKELGGIHTRLPKGEAHFNHLFHTYVKTAREKKREFLLTREQFRELISQPCTYCGKKPESRWADKKGNGSILSNGIDRIDSFGGYTMENSVPCCKRCNVAKNNMTTDEFREWIKRLYSNYILGSK